MFVKRLSGPAAVLLLFLAIAAPVAGAEKTILLDSPGCKA